MTVFITGPGRSGTSFLVQLLTRLDFDTGYEAYIYEGYHPEVRAGCEAPGPSAEILEIGDKVQIQREFERSPRILKGPIWAYLLKFFYINQLTEIERVIMPMRDLTESAYSRLDAGLDFLMDKEFVKVPGIPLQEVQENILAMLVGKVMEACYLYDIPLTMMRFPESVTDEEYCYRKVTELEPINRQRFGKVFRELANPSQIKWSGRASKEQVRYPA